MNLSKDEKLQSNIEENSIFDLRTSRGKYTFVVISVLISVLIQFVPSNFVWNLDFVKSISFSKASNYCNPTINKINIINQAKYAIYGKSPSEDHLVHVENVLNRLNYKRVSIEDDWNLLWAHDYPFRVLSNKLRNFKKFQKINHIPGSGYITNKVDFSITNLSFIPKSFRLPKDKDLFNKYSKKNPSKLFVQKHNQHRHIRIISVENIKMNELSNDTFIQAFINNPYLIDGYKFDIGVYVIITNIDPLRVYIYTGDVLFRFCPVKYHPFDQSNIDKYIVGDDYLPIWNIPSLIKYYEKQKYGMKDTFDAYMLEHNQDPTLIWDQVEYQIRTIILEKEKYILKIYNRFKQKNNFFELMRFDLIIDENLKVYLMEANMSPNLSSAHFKPNTLLYEQILYNLMNLVGLASPIIQSTIEERQSGAFTMIHDYKNIVTFPEICSNSPCTISCNEDKCKICIQCLNKININVLYNAFREHIHKANTKRIFPVPITKVDTYNFEKETLNLTSQNKFMSLWFYGKCKLDSTWCV